MKNKKGLLWTQIIKIIIAVLCLVILGILLVAIYNLFTGNKEKEQAKATLEAIFRAMSDADNSEDKSADVIITTPKGWFIVSFPDLNSRGLILKLPTTCSSNRCLCVCSKPENCVKDKICRDITARKFIVDKLDVRVSMKIEKPFILRITSETNRYVFSLGEELNPNIIILEGDLGATNMASFEKMKEAIGLKNSVLNLLAVKKGSTEKAVIFNIKSIKDGSGANNINAFVVLAILDVKYNMFDVSTMPPGLPEEFDSRVRNAVFRAFVKERVLANEKGVDCEVNSNDYLESLSKCIAKVLNYGRKNAEIFFGGEISKAEKEISGIMVKPENIDTAALYFYSQNFEEVVKIGERYKSYSERHKSFPI